MDLERLHLLILGTWVVDFVMSRKVALDQEGERVPGREDSSGVKGRAGLENGSSGLRAARGER